jgi:hypothetical protein
MDRGRKFSELEALHIQTSGIRRILPSQSAIGQE